MNKNASCPANDRINMWRNRTYNYFMALLSQEALIGGFNPNSCGEIERIFVFLLHASGNYSRIN